MSATLWAPGSLPQTNTNTTRIVEEFVASAGQTEFLLTLFTYSPGTQSLAVYRNGELVAPSGVAEDAAGDKFTLSPCTVNDVIVAEGLVGIVGSPSVPGDGSVTTAKLAATLIVPVNKGGTGAITALQARTNLDITPINIGALATGDIGTTVQAYDPDTVKRDIETSFTAQQIAFSGVLTDAGTVAWDADTNGQIVAITLGGSRTMGAPTNIVQYGVYILRVAQDAVGGRTLAWDAAYKFGTAAAPTLTVAANKVDILSFIGGAGDTLEFLGIRKDAV